MQIYTSSYFLKIFHIFKLIFIHLKWILDYSNHSIATILILIVKTLRIYKSNNLTIIKHKIYKLFSLVKLLRLILNILIFRTFLYSPPVICLLDYYFNNKRSILISIFIPKVLSRSIDLLTFLYINRICFHTLLI